MELLNIARQQSVLQSIFTVIDLTAGMQKFAFKDSDEGFKYKLFI